MNEKIKKLNKEQEQAVLHENGPMLVVAGAGTGKTTILVERLRHLVEKKMARGDEVLLLTFTEKGAGEMEDRALEILPYGYFDLWISTFHGFCERILREHALDIGLNPDFKIISSTEQWILIKKNLDAFELSYYKPLGNPNKFIYELVKHFSRLKDECIFPLEYSGFAKDLAAGKVSVKNEVTEEDEESGQEIDRYLELAKAYEIYNKLLLENGVLDFGDLIIYTLKLFETRPAILRFYREKFKYIMIDEFQDTNWSQYALIKLLASPQNNLLVVGDDDQSIYKFRGASLSNILQFKDDYPKSKETILIKNYRSGQEILDVAYRFIQNNNPNRLEEKIKICKKLESGSSIKSQVVHNVFQSIIEEEEWVAKQIWEIKKSNRDVTWSDFAILVRANSSAEAYVGELKRVGIPNTFVSLRGLYYKSIIIDCVSYLKLLDNYHESSALFRVLNMDVFKVEHKDLVAISRYARKKSWSLFEALKNLSSIPDISEEGATRISFLLGLIIKHSQLVQKESASRIFVYFVHDAGLDKKKFHENREYFSHLNQFYEKIKKFDNDMPGSRLKDFLELYDMELESGETGSLRLDYDDADTVSIMTVHASKGLEFKYVFLVNLVDKRFPTINRQDKIVIPDQIVKEKIVSSKNSHTEEERRLFYVALTRAKEILFLSSAKNCGGSREKKTSVFIQEAQLETHEDQGGGSESNLLLRDIGIMNSPIISEKLKYEIPGKFSFSQIEAYANCPLQYKFNFILKIPVPSKAVLIFGRLMHNVLKETMSTLIISKQASMFEAESRKVKTPTLQAFLENYKKYWSDDGYESKEQREQYRQLGLEMLDNFFHANSNYTWPKVKFVEKKFIYRIGNYIFKGSIDRVDLLPDNTYEIIDYKTGSSKEKIGYKEKRQLILYKLALEEGLGIKVSKLSFFYLKDGAVSSFESKLKDEDKLKLEILDTISKISDGIFDPHPGPLCGYCDFNSICEFRQS